MKRAKIFPALVLLLFALTVTGCGNGKEQEDIGSGQSAGTEPGMEDAKADATGEPEGDMVLRHNKLYIYLTNLETGDEEGTAHLRMVNRTEDSDISITIEKVRIDGWESEWQTDEGGAITLAGGETKDAAVRFSRPDAGDDVTKLSECAYIRFEIVGSGLSENGDIHADVYVKGDKDIAETISLEQNRKPAVEEQEIYNDNGIVITVTGMNITEGERGGVTLFIEFTNNGKIAFSPYVKELYVGDTLVRTYTDALSENKDAEIKNYVTTTSGGSTMPGEAGAGEIAIVGEEMAQLVKEELPVISVVFEFRVEEGGDLIQTPKLPIPVVLK